MSSVHGPRKRTAAFWRLVAGRSRSGRARGLLLAWRLWELLASRLWPAPPIPGAPYGIFRVRFARYKGPSFELPDGTSVRTGDLVGEFHLDNRTLVGNTESGRWDLFPRTRDDLRALARWSQMPDFPSAVQAFYGVTLLGRGAVRLGMVIHPRPLTVSARLERMYFSGLLLLYSNEGERRYNRGETRSVYPEEIWLSRRELMRRYGPTESG
jgi:hypothetical protein